MSKTQSSPVQTANKPLILANWKMNLSLAEAEALAAELKRRALRLADRVQIVLLPTYTALERVRSVVRSTSFELGSQDVFWAERGNYTGEVSAGQLLELGCRWVLIGHSERRNFLHEDAELIDRKTAAAVQRGLTPVVCVGETRDQRNQSVQDLAVADQVKSAFHYVRPPFRYQRIVVAYEPVWSIYPGQPCEPADAQAMAEVIRQALIDVYDVRIVTDNFSIVYGGSVDASNVRDYVNEDGFDGALVGNASLSATTFIQLIEALAQQPAKPFQKAKPIIRAVRKPIRR